MKMNQYYDTNKKDLRTGLITVLNKLTKDQLISVVLQQTDTTEVLLRTLLEVNDVLKETQVLLTQVFAQVEVIQLNNGFSHTTNILESSSPFDGGVRGLSTLINNKKVSHVNKGNQLPDGQHRSNNPIKYNITNLKVIIKMVMLLFKVDGKALTRTISILNQIRRDNGIVFMYKYMKISRLHITRYICGRKLLSVRGSGVSTVNGGPKRFLFLKDLLADDKSMQYLLSIATITKGIKPVKKERELIRPSFDPITDAYKGKTYVIPAFFIDVMMRKYHIRGKDLEVPSSKTLFLNMKKSPTGVSITSAFPAALLHPISMYKHFEALLLEAFDSIYIKAVNFAFEHSQYHPNCEAGKIAIVHDAEGKERIIAMSDYWSQWALKPIHDHCLNILKSIPMDRTFTQNPLTEGKDDGQKYWSLDLTSATDRFPLFVQHKIIKRFYGDDVADAGAAMLIDRNYSFEGTNYRYSVGQPMGCYSSGAVFALTHHFVVQWAAYRCGIKDFTDYILLGDDIVIKNNRVAIRYMQLMKAGGVDISLTKTHVSNHTYEFAKQGIHFGRNISPLPVKGIMTHIHEPKSILILLIDGVLKTKFTSDGSSIYILVKESFKRTKIWKQWWTEPLLDKVLRDFWFGLSYTKGIIEPETLRSYGLEKGYSEDVVPIGEEVFSFTKRLTNFSLGNLISKTIKNLEDYSERFIKEFFMNKYSSDLIPLHPMAHALGNTLEHITKKLKSFDPKVHSALDITDVFVIPGINEIVHLKRQVRKEVIGIDRLGKESIHPTLLGNPQGLPTYEDLVGMGLDEIWIANANQAIYKAGNRFEVIRSGKYDAWKSSQEVR